MRLPQSEQDSDGPNLTPVIDIVFLLLIFFLVATRFDEQEREQDLPLAKVAVAAEPIGAAQDLVINIMPDGKYRVVQVDYSEAELAALLRNTGQVNPHKRVLLRVAGKAPFESVARAASRCRDAELKYTTAVLPET